jgi:hypothetical protein
MNLLVQLVTAIAWPIVVLWIAYLFKGELRDLIGRVSRFRYKELEFELGLARAEKSIAVIEHSIQSLPTANAVSSTRLQQLRELADVSPRAAILEAWIMIEEAAARSGFVTGAQVPRTNVMSFVDWLIRTGKLPAESELLVQQLRTLRNQAAHYFEFTVPAFELKREDADRYLDIAAKVSSLILGPGE